MSSTHRAGTPQPFLDAALTYAARGWRVIPIKPGQKYPAMPAWQKEGSTDPDRIIHWWTNQPDYGIGIVTGRDSGIFVLDIDITDGKAGDETLNDLETRHRRLPDTVEVITGTGGRHLYFQLPPGVDIRNDAGRRLGPGLDIRGEGGQVLAPPTIHPNGRPYLFEASSGPDIIVAQPPAWLLELLTTEPEHQPTTAASAAGDRPGDLWAAATTWNEILEADGWLHHHTDRTGETHWTRPGKDRREGTSATTGYRGSDVLKVFSTSLGRLGLEAEQTYTKFRYLSLTRFHGDDQATARALKDAGYRPAEVDLAALIDTTPPAADSDWPEPIPLGATHQLPAFPVHVLPEWAAEHAAAVADDIQAPVDLTAMLALGALSTLTAGHIRINIHNQWSEHTNLYLVVIMPPSTGKSPAYKAMCGPIYELQDEYQRMVRAAVAANLDKIDALEAQLAKAKKADDIDERRLAHIREQLFLAREQPTHLPELILDDATPEALGKAVADNQGPVAIHSTEGGLFDMMTGRYSERANLDIYLKGWSGDRLSVHRIGREANVANEVVLTIVLTVQPDVIRALADRPELAGRGVTARFMYSHPVDVLGRRDRRFRDIPQTGTKYADRLLEIGRQMLSWQHPATLTLAPEAKTMFEQWIQATEARKLPYGDLRDMAEWSSKLESSTLRVAAILHIAHGYNHTEQVSGNTMRLALEVAAYWLAHAAFVHDLWGSNQQVQDARVVAGWLASQEHVTVRDIHEKHKKRFKKVEDVLPVLEMLAEHYWVRTADGGPIATTRNQGRAGGRKSVEILVNPNAANAANGNAANAANAAPKDSKKESISLSESVYGQEPPVAPFAPFAALPDEDTPTDDPADPLGLFA